MRINCISAGLIDDAGGEVNGASSNGGVQDKASSGNVDSIGLERAGLPQEVARVVGFLSSGFSSFVNGANIVVDGGGTTGL